MSLDIGRYAVYRPRSTSAPVCHGLPQAKPCKRMNHNLAMVDRSTLTRFLKPKLMIVGPDADHKGRPPPAGTGGHPPGRWNDPCSGEAERLPAEAHASLIVLAAELQAMRTLIASIEKRIIAHHRLDEASKRLRSLPRAGSAYNAPYQWG
jgi:hypothetical protein